MSMFRIVAQMLTVIRALAFCRVVALMVIVGLVAGPFFSALNAHHANETEAAVSGLSPGFSDPGDVRSDDLQLAVVSADHDGKADRGENSEQPATKPSTDHTCHGCGTMFLTTVAATRFESLPLVQVSLDALLGIGRTVPTDLRPPRV